MHSDERPGDFVGVRSRFSANVSQVGPDSYAFTVTRLNTTRSYEPASIRNTTSVFAAQGTLTANTETGGTRVTGDVRHAPLMVAAFGIAVVYLPILVIRGEASLVIGLVVLVMFAYLAYSKLKDRNEFLQDIRSL